MAWQAFIQLFANFFTVLSWPSFTLVYPLFASFRAIESDSQSKNQQCLSYWVLFALVKISESALANLLNWLPIWPYTRGVITVLLVIPYFGGASFVYRQFIRSYISQSSFTWTWNISSVDSIPKERDFIENENENFVAVAANNIFEVELDESAEEHTLCQAKLVAKPPLKKNANTPLSTSLYTINLLNAGKIERQPEFSPETTGWEFPRPASAKRVQKEWCCPLCLVRTTSKKCLSVHLKGNKHKAKEDELEAYKQAKKNGYKSSLVMKGTKGMVFLNNLKHIAVNLEKCRGILGSIRLCRWKKPDFGWTKLNTDGSIDRENAGFGGLLRDFNGDPICAFVSKAPRDDIFAVELWGIWRGLVLALGLGIRVIWVESDSMSAVKTINREQSYSEKAITCLNQIWDLLNKFDKYVITHSWRETNRAADHLAKMVPSAGNDDVFFPDDFPASLWNIIKDDAQGRIYVRSNIYTIEQFQNRKSKKKIKKKLAYNSC